MEMQNGSSKGRRNKTAVRAVFALILLAVGYFAMINMWRLQVSGIVVSLITVTSGTYMLFGAVLPLIVKMIKSNKKFNEKGVNAFTFAQLNYRISNLTKVLATITMLVALGAGAISGDGFKNNIPFQLDKFTYYDVTIHNPTAEEKKILSDIKFTETREYRYKVDEKFVYFIKEDLEKDPLLIEKDADGSKS